MRSPMPVARNIAQVASISASTAPTMNRSNWEKAIRVCPMLSPDWEKAGEKPRELLPQMLPATPSRTTRSPMVTMTGLISGLPCSGLIRILSTTAPRTRPIASAAANATQ